MNTLQAPRGCPDLFHDDVLKHNYIVQKAREVVELYGFLEHKTPIFEFSEVFFKNLGESSDIVTKEMYTFLDKGQQSLTLRPEATASVVRMFISHKFFRKIPFKVFYEGPMFRYERPQKGRLRQFHQIGVECLGLRDPKVDTEVIVMGWNILSVLGIQSKCSLYLNSIGNSKERELYKSQLTHYLSQKKDQLSQDSQSRLQTNPLRILDSKDLSDQEILKTAPCILESLSQASRSYFDQIQNYLTLLNIPYKIHPQLVRGLDYYSDTVFEITTQELGAQGAVLAGGRYDSLVSHMGGPDCPSIGWAAGIERLALMIDLPQKSKIKIGVIDIDHSHGEFLMKVTEMLRHKNLFVYWSASGNLTKQIKKCEREGCQYMVLFGEKEIQSQNVQIKNLTAGEQKEIPIDQIPSYIF